MTGCPWCGAPIDVRLMVSESGWMKQPKISTMTRLSCGKIECQIAGRNVPAAEFGLTADDWVYFSPQALLWGRCGHDAAPAVTGRGRHDESARARACRGSGGPRR
jgi:hypothetical protein